MALETNYYDLGRDAVACLRALDEYVGESRVEEALLELVRLRASQINGCAYCVQLHSTAARERGESGDRLHAVAVWKESSEFTTRERATLAWAEAVTRLPDGISTDVHRAVRTHFSEGELVDLTFGIIVINAWNRLSVSFREPEVPG